jgi:hypothetical protein
MSDGPVNQRLLELLRKKRVVGACSVLLQASGVTSQQTEIPVPVERIVAAHGIGTVLQSMAADGYLSKAEDRPFIFVNSERDVMTRRFIIGHEFAHWLLAEKCGIAAEAPGISNGREVIERLCDEFAGALLAPSSYIAAALGQGSVQIAFPVLEGLARRLEVPLRGVLSGIWRSGALTPRGIAILVLRSMSNPWGGKEWELRIWRAYCPEWCFVPECRARKVGLLAIRAAWPSLRPGQECSVQESLRLYSTEALASASNISRAFRTVDSGRWQQDPREGIEVKYKVYRDAFEGIFVVGIFKLSRPPVLENTKHGVLPITV